MNESAKLQSQELEITNALGLHARSAALLAGLARRAGSPVWLTKGEDTVDASSIIDILTLACTRGSKIKLTISDPSDRAILKEMVALVENGFEE